MDVLLGLISLVFLVGAIQGIFAFRKASKLEREIKLLRDEVALLKAGGVAVPAAEQESEPAIAVAATAPEPERASDAVSPEAETVDDLPAGPDAPIPPPPAPPAAKKRGFIDELGARWSVWVGGIALALGAIFLVRYSIEAGFFGPGMRTACAALLGVIALGAGEWLRRSDPQERPEAAQGAYIPGVLTGVGILALFGAVYASYELYGFIGSGAAFALMGLVSAGGMALGLRQGPAISGLGLVGSFVTPVLVSTAEPSYPGLYAYLAIVSLAALVLAGYRTWSWLSFAAAGGALAWGLFGLWLHGPDEWTIWLIYLGAVLAMVYVTHVLPVVPFVSGDRSMLQATVLPCLSYGFVALLLLGMLHVDETSLRSFLACLIAGLIGLALAWPYRRLAPIPLIAAVLVLLAGIARGAVLSGGILYWPIDGFHVPTPLEGDWGQHVALAAGFGVVAAVVSAVWLRRHAGAPVRQKVQWSLAGCLFPLLIILSLWLLGARSNTQWEFAALFAMHLLLAGAAAEWLVRGLERDDADGALILDPPANLFALAAAISATFALIAAFDLLWLTLSLAGLVALIAGAHTLRPIWSLRLAAPGAGAVLALQALDAVTLDRLSNRIVLNGLWFYFAVPALAAGAAAWLLSRKLADKWSQAMEALALAFAALFAVFQVRHFMNDGDLFAPSLTLEELSLQILVGLSFSLGLSRIKDVGRLSLFSIAAMAAMGVSLLSILFGSLFVFSPLMASWNVVKGGPIFNTLLLGYFAPGLFLGLIAWLQQERRPGWYVKTLGGVSLLLLITYLTMMVRFFFEGGDRMHLFTHPVSNIEQYVHSIVWLAFGIALLVGGLVFKNRELRIGSAAVMVLTVAKVFFVDMSELEGILRALSFVGLGAVLIGMGLVYQRVLGRDDTDASASPAEAEAQS
ncbi:MAG: DUF2339 domain-containing protein [Pseudomonadota bacterium]